MLHVEKIEKLLYPFTHSNFRQASYLSTGYSDCFISSKGMYMMDLLSSVWNPIFWYLIRNYIGRHIMKPFKKRVLKKIEG